MAVPDAPYDVHVGEGVLAMVAAATRDCDRVAVVADREVCDLHGELAQHGIEAPSLAYDAGEGIKTLSVLEEVLDFCAASKLSRASILIAYGGGTIGDLTGLAASLFKRGMRVIQVPTTLLAQVDASVGGKTAVNLAAGKNLAGTFHQPHAVFCDTRLLGTLSEPEFQSGLGEVLKTALIEGEDALAHLEQNAAALTARDSRALAETVTRCVTTKARVVVSDPEERGARRSLNLGHTFAHAIEHAAGYGRVPHGVAVAVGLQLAVEASVSVYGSPEALSGLGARVDALLSAFGLPRNLDELRGRYDLGRTLHADALIEGLGHDKKGRVGTPEFVLLKAPGEVEAGVSVSAANLREWFA